MLSVAGAGSRKDYTQNLLFFLLFFTFFNFWKQPPEPPQQQGGGIGINQIIKTNHSPILTATAEP
jgi:hypothetical protein